MKTRRRNGHAGTRFRNQLEFGFFARITQSSEARRCGLLQEESGTAPSSETPRRGAGHVARGCPDD